MLMYVIAYALAAAVVSLLLTLVAVYNSKHYFAVNPSAGVLAIPVAVPVFEDFNGKHNLEVEAFLVPGVHQCNNMKSIMRAALKAGLSSDEKSQKDDPIIAINLLSLAVKLIRDTEYGHRNQEDGFNYNECDRSPCNYCVIARHFLSEAERIYGFDKREIA